jgi:peptide/nickel transport system ATP-binding protein
MRRVRGKEIGAVFQDPLMSLNPLLTIGEQLDETITTHLPVGPREARARSLELLHAVGIPAPEARYASFPHQLSGGMRQRVVIALALCAEPRLVVADEPTTALDVSIQAQVLALLRKLCGEKGTAMLLVTHDMGVIAETADRVAVMYAGRIVEIGSVEDVIRAPVHPYTRGLMGAIPTLGRIEGPLSQIEGAMPHLNARPSGCAYHPRCPRAVARCRAEMPSLEPHGTRSVACLRAGEPQ